MKKLKAIEVGYNKKGEKIALCKDCVWILSENYSRGSIVKNWRCIIENVSEEEARKVFNRRTNK